MWLESGSNWRGVGQIRGHLFASSTGQPSSTIGIHCLRTQITNGKVVLLSRKPLEKMVGFGERSKRTELLVVFHDHKSTHPPFANALST